MFDIEIGSCPACGDPIDYCQGHGEIGDPEGFAILARHDDGDHRLCHPKGCEPIWTTECSHAVNSDCPHYS